MGNPAGWVRDGARDVRQVARGWRWGRRSLVPRSAEEFAAPTQPSVFGTAWSRSPAARAAREVVQKAALEPVFRSQVRTRTEGLDVLTDLTGPVIFVANHASHLDTPLILLSLPDSWRRRTAVAAAADYFFDTWWRAVGSAVFFNALPIERRGGSLAVTPGEVLDEGWNLVIFPEGTRTHDGWVDRFQPGAAFLAVRHRVPVVPIAIRGTFAAMPRGQGWPARGRRPLTIRYGRPLHPGADETTRAFAARVRDGVGALLDEDRSTWWAARRRAASGTIPDVAGPSVARWRRVWEQTAPIETDRGRAAWRS
jgi:1-acyl-sn-glycerol-3-phosphate acyltransferase